MTFARQFRRLREAHGLTQEDIGLRLNPPYSSTAVWKWETGAAGPLPGASCAFLRELAPWRPHPRPARVIW